MKRLSIFCFLLIILLIISFSCTSTSDGTEPAELIDIDQLIILAADSAVDLLSDQEIVLAVYYFTTGGEISELSDYLINGLTTEIANRVGNNIRIVSRQALDRIFEESAYQLSAMVDQEQQVSLGQQLGADMILTGFIDILENQYKLNMQLIEIESAQVLGGYITGFDPGGFNISKPLDSEINFYKREFVHTEGSATVTTIIEDFESEISDISLHNFEEAYGERIVYTEGSVNTIRENNNGFARYTFKAEFDQLDLITDWEDSDAVFYFNLPTGINPAAYDGIALSIRPHGYSMVSISAKQYHKNEYYLFESYHLLLPEVWNTIKIPWETLEIFQHEASLDPDSPIEIELATFLNENIYLYHFRNSLDLDASVDVDNIGFFTRKQPGHPEVIENFEDEISEMTFYGEIYGSTNYRDYSESDEGVLKKNELVQDQKLQFQILPDGPAGNYFHAAAELSLIDHEDKPEMSLYIKTAFAKNWKEYDFLTFLIKSESLSSGGLEIYDSVNDSYGWADIGIQAGWTRVRVPLNELKQNLKDLGRGAEEPVKNQLMLYLELSEPQLLKALRAGTLIMDVSIDEIIFE
ncbi:MAG: hypothetical protein JEY91_07545 [Spirochaetaceae bacterium]|nr:hypothetical protein [Spirochaetaceae bacterium]